MNAGDDPALRIRAATPQDIAEMIPVVNAAFAVETFLEEFLQGITVLSLRPELPPIYRKLGYAETGTEEFHRSQPLKSGVVCHAIVMSKALTSSEPDA